MYNYKIMRISYLAPCIAGFCAILFLTVFFGVFVALWDHDLLCLISSTCLGVIFGIIGSSLIFLALFIFNLFIPITKGIPIQLSAMDIPDDTPANTKQMQDD